MKLYIYCMAIFAMMQLLVACESGSNSSSEIMVQDVQLEAIQSTDQLLQKQPIQADSITEQSQVFNTEDYDHIIENKFLFATQQPLSTFSIDVDRAAYSNVRRFIESGQMPPKGAVRIEEMINYFDYKYQPPSNDEPFAIHTEIASCPWNTKHTLVQIGLQGKPVTTDNIPPSNFVFLVDVSGSMNASNKLPLVQESLKLLTDQLREDDNVAIVVYAGNAGLILPSTNGSEKIKIKNAIDNLNAGGSTAGGEGIKLAYKIAEENKKQNSNNRVILATDGDFNVGISSDDELVELIEKEKQSGIFLSVLGFGTGNYKDNKMELLADKGNGNHNYIDNLNEAKKVLVHEFGGTLFTIAKDVKLQVEFNPAKVNAYRLIGYENRMLANEDFNDDKKDAGELGAGHTVTALYEIIPAGMNDSLIGKVDDLKYQKKLEITYRGNELMNIKLRYKKPESDQSNLIIHAVADDNKKWQDATQNFKLSAAVAEFGLLLRESSYKQNSSYEQALALAKNINDDDRSEYRSELIKLIEQAQLLQSNN